MRPGRLQDVPWGPKQVLIGLGLFAAVFLFTQALIVVIAAAGHDFVPYDTGDVFDKAGDIARYGDERLAAATGGAELPEAPRILADANSLLILLGATFVSQGFFVFIVLAATRLRSDTVTRALGLRKYTFSDLWRPAAVVVAAYLGVAIYSVAMTALGVDFLEPKSTVPSGVVRHGETLALAGVLAVISAPIAEELFFRGLVFGGLVRWGFWPAAAVSAALFTLSHLDPGSVIPFFWVGMAMAWLFWSRGSLWDSIAFHFLFNLTSFLLLLAGT